MSTEQESYSTPQFLETLETAQKQGLSDVVWDKDLMTLPWALQGLSIPPNAVRVFMALAFLKEGKLVGTLLFHDGYAAHDVWWTIYTTHPSWCCKRFLKKAFRAAFCDLKCRRIGILVRSDNEKSLKLVRGLGFSEEGRLRAIGENGEDCYVFSLLKEECRFL